MGPWLRHSGALVSAVLGLPVLAGALLRSRWRAGVRQRLGVAGPWEPGSVWVHAASVGEVMAATRLFESLEARGLLVSASATTPAGFDVLARNRPDLTARLAPLDHPWCASAAIRRGAPRALVLVETELWPTWIAAAARRGIPVLLVSARLSDRSLPRYQRLRWLFQRTWPRLAAIGARSERDAERFRSLGADPAQVHVTGDLKFDPPARLPALAPELATFLGEHAPWAAISVHKEEEGAVLDAFVAAQSRNPERRLLLAPRHLGRITALQHELRARGLRWALRSNLAGAAFEPGSVLLIDTLGEGPTLLSKAAFVFVGGTLAPVGAHNVLEPAWAHRAVLFGPHTSNVADAVERLRAAGAATPVADAAALRAAVIEGFERPDASARQGEAAFRAVAAHCGAAERAADLVERSLAPRGGAAIRIGAPARPPGTL